MYTTLDLEAASSNLSVWCHGESLQFCSDKATSNQKANNVRSINFYIYHVIYYFISENHLDDKPSANLDFWFCCSVWTGTSMTGCLTGNLTGALVVITGAGVLGAGVVVLLPLYRKYGYG